MKIDYEDAGIELTETEAETFTGSGKLTDTLRAYVIDAARDLADHTDRTVYIADVNGKHLAYCDADGIREE